MRILITIIISFVPQFSIAMNHEGRLEGSRQRNVIKEFEREGKLQRDLLGRKLVISPNSKIDKNSLQLEIAPWSTVILHVQQHDIGSQVTRTPFYKNVEMPK